MYKGILSSEDITKINNIIQIICLFNKFYFSLFLLFQSISTNNLTDKPAMMPAYYFGYIVSVHIT